MEGGVTEGEDSAVGGHQPVATAVGGGRQGDDRPVEGECPVGPVGGAGPERRDLACRRHQAVSGSRRRGRRRGRPRSRAWRCRGRRGRRGRRWCRRRGRRRDRGRADHQAVDQPVGAAVLAAVALQLRGHIGALGDLVPRDQQPARGVGGGVPGVEGLQRGPVVTRDARRAAVELPVEPRCERGEVGLPLGVQRGRQAGQLLEALGVAPRILTRPVGAVGIEVRSDRAVPGVPLVAAHQVPGRVEPRGHGGDDRQRVLVGPDPDQGGLAAVAPVERRIVPVLTGEVVEVGGDRALGQDGGRRLVGDPEVELLTCGLRPVHRMDEHVESGVLRVGGRGLSGGPGPVPVHGETGEAGGDGALDVVVDLRRVVLREQRRRAVRLDVAAVEAGGIAPGRVQGGR